VFAALEGTAPRPWLSRERGECAFPVAGEGWTTISCCAPTPAGRTYCAAHHRIVFKAPSASVRDAEARRWIERAAPWAA
jgi:hypothetical protein